MVKQLFSSDNLAIYELDLSDNASTFGDQVVWEAWESV
jgi:hypothetical protein